MTKRWVMIETGGNQKYIFGSNRYRHVVGASERIWRATTDWVAGAAVGRGEVVVATSGKALVLVDDAAAGQAVIRDVTGRALVEAPGLEVTGVVGPAFDESVPYVAEREGGRVDLTPEAPLDHARALAETHRRQGRVRAARPSRMLRDPVLPWNALCRETGMPAARFDLYGATPRDQRDWHPASASVLARSAIQWQARDRLVGLLGSCGDVVPENLDDLVNDGWIAVVHADGNGVGRLFRRFPDLVAEAAGVAELTLDTHMRYQAGFARELQEATEQAFRAAVAAVVDPLAKDRRGGTVLPIVVGGDDVTFACHGGLALDIVRVFLDKFEASTAAAEKVSALVTAAGQVDPDAPAASSARGLTAAAGIAIVKPHHPFAAAYDLAEELTTSAKAVKTEAASVPASSFDVHVAHESTLRQLRQLRRANRLGHGRDVFDRHAGPYVVVDRRAVPAAAPDDEREWIEAHHVESLAALMHDLGPRGWLSSSRAHALRAALDRGVPEYEAELELVIDRARTERAADGESAPDAASTDLLRRVTDEPATTADPADDRARRRYFFRLPDAMLVDGVVAPLVPDEPIEPAPTDEGIVTVP